MRDDSVTKVVDAEAFRQTMSLFATGVSVISAVSEGQPRGFTANSLVSVSLDPMLVCWSIQNTSSQFALYSEARDFTVSILGEGQNDIAERYSKPGHSETRIDDFVWIDGGLPVVAGAIATIHCRQWSLYPAGDHTMIFGEVVGVEANNDAAPLTYFRGAFSALGT
ncbi:MAG: flavin reductase family protein [Erythrobacter sp.]